MKRNRRSLVRGAWALIAVTSAALWILGSPAWSTYCTERHIADALSHADAAKLVVMEQAAIRGGVAEVDGGDMRYNASVSDSPYVSRVVVADGGIITLTTRDTGARPDPVIVLVPIEDKDRGVIRWNCEVFDGDRSLAPPDCQNVWPTPYEKPDTTLAWLPVSLL